MLDKLPIKKGLIMLGLVALVVLATSANAAIDLKDTVDFTIPMQYRGDSVEGIVFTDQGAIDKKCGKAPKGYINMACSFKGNIIFMPNPCRDKDVEDPTSYSHLLCHEIAHTNGWHHVNE